MAFTKIHHVGMMVRDLEEARRLFCDAFGLAVDERRSPLPEGRHVAFDNVNILDIPFGETEIEVNRPNDPDSGSARFLAGRGGVGALHHVCLYSDDIAQDVPRLRENGLQQVLPPGREWEVGRPAFFHPRSCLGILLEVWPRDEYYPHPAYRGDSPFTGLAHVGIVARDEEEVRHFWQDQVGLTLDTGRTRAASDNVRVIEFPVGGSVVEISIPQDTISGTARFLASRGPAPSALHHICPWAPDVHRAVDKLRAAGLQQIGNIPPRSEARGNVVAWFHPKSCLGTLVEIWNRAP